MSMRDGFRLSNGSVADYDKQLRAVSRERLHHVGRVSAILAGGIASIALLYGGVVGVQNLFGEDPPKDPPSATDTAPEEAGHNTTTIVVEAALAAGIVAISTGIVYSLAHNNQPTVTGVIADAPMPVDEPLTTAEDANTATEVFIPSDTAGLE